MATQFEATLRLVGSDETGEAFRSAALRAKEFAQQQAQSSRAMEADLNSVGRAIRGVRRGIAVGGATALLTDAIKSAADYNKQLKQIQLSAGATPVEMRKVADALEKEADRINENVSDVTAGFNAWRLATGQTLEEAIKSFPMVASAAKVADVPIKDLATLAGRLQTNLKIPGEAMKDSIDVLTKALVDAGVPIELASTNFTDLSEKAERIGLRGKEGLDQLIGGFNAINKEAKNPERAFKVLGDVMEKATDPNFLSERIRGGLQKAMKEAVAEGRNVFDVIGQIATRMAGESDAAWKAHEQQMIRTFGPDIYALIAKVKDGTIDVDTATKELANSHGYVEKNLKTATEGMDEDLKRLGNQWDKVKKQIGNVAIQINQSLGKDGKTALENFAQDLNNLAEVIKNPGKHFTSLISQLKEKLPAALTGATQKAVEFGEKAADAVSGVTTQVGEAIATSAVGQAIGAIPPSELAAAATAPPAEAEPPKYTAGWWQKARGAVGLQQGGPAGRGQPYLVGERGPELFVPDVNGSIVPGSTRRGAAASAFGAGGNDEELQATLRNTQAMTDATRQQRSLIEVLTELNNYMKKLADAEAKREREAREARESIAYEAAIAAGEAAGPPAPAPVRAAMEERAAPPPARQTIAANLSLSPEARGLLDTIAGTESGGRDPYTQLYGGRNVQLGAGAAAPAVPIRTGPNVGRTSSAYGRYQFINPTWFETSRKITAQRPELAQAFAERTPEAQDLAAWVKAQERYARGSGGRSLQADLEAGQLHPGGQAQLAAEWTSLPGGIEQARGGTQARFQQRLQTNIMRQARREEPQPEAPRMEQRPPAEAPRIERAGYDEDALARARAERAELSKPIPITFEYQPGQNSMMRQNARQIIDREMKESSWNQYTDGVRV